MPYLTPPDLPEDDDCRPLLIPASSDWLALFGGALTELTKTWNWEDSGGLTVSETVAKMEEILAGWYSDPCDQCELPEGGSIIRINDEGKIEELIDGEWVEPTGDYVIPPPEAREGGTADDQICLAAANAVNVLHELYDQLQSYFNDELSAAAALLGLAGFMTTVTAFEFAPIVAGIAAFMLPIFAGVYSALSYLTADLWSEDLDRQIKCFLVECATNDAGVVTFDWDCFTGKLNSLTDEFGLSEVELRFYLQISYLLFFIGGIDGLNLAAGTTAITEAECDCAVYHCHYFDFTIDDGGFAAPYPGFPTYASTWSSGIGWTPFHSGVDGLNGFALTFSEPVTINSATAHWTGSGGGSSPYDSISIQFFLSGSVVATVNNHDSQNDGCMNEPVGGYVADQVAIGGNTIWASGTFAFTGVAIAYNADSLVLGDDNCDEEPACP